MALAKQRERWYNLYETETRDRWRARENEHDRGIRMEPKTVLTLLADLNEKLSNDPRIDGKASATCQSCIHAMDYILQPIPHRAIAYPEDGTATYSEYLKRISRSVRRNRGISDTNYRNLSRLMETLQTELWCYK